MNGKLLIGLDEVAGVRRELRDAITSANESVRERYMESRLSINSMKFVDGELSAIKERVERALDVIELRRLKEGVR